MINLRSFTKQMNDIRKSLTELAKSLSTDETILSQVESEVKLDDLSFFKVSFILFTEKKEHQSIDKIINDIGIQDTLNFNDLCEGKINGTLSLENGVRCNLSFYHFDHYPDTVSEDFNAIFKIIIYDQEYISKYEKWKLAMDTLGKDPAILTFINISKNKEHTAKPKINCIHSFQYHSNEIEGSILLALLQAQNIPMIQFARIQKYIRHAQQLHTLFNSDYESKFETFNEKSESVKKEHSEAKENLKNIISKDLTQLKQQINEESKKNLQLVDHNLESFEKESTDLQKLKAEIVSFEGFVEKKQSKIVELAISKWAVEDKSEKMIQLLHALFEDTTKSIMANYSALKLGIKDTFQESNLGIINLPKFSFGHNQIKESLSVIEISSDKSYERQIPSKGIGALMMELRTPLFMLMPFMMIFGLFGALIKSDDKGIVDESVLFYQNKPCIAITKLPENRDGQYLKFINDIESLRTPGSGVFNKEIKGEMVMVPQLAVQKKIVKQSFRNQNKIIETLDYHFDKKNEKLYIYLKQNSDRNYVVQQLFNPQNSLLSYPASTKSSMGMGGMIKAFAKLKDYRIIILLTLSLLVIWFVITRKKSMKLEFTSLRAKEQKKLNTEVLQFIDKNAKQGTQRFHAKIIQKIKEHQNDLLKKLEDNYSKRVEIEKDKREIQSKKLQQKLNDMKKEKMSFMKVENNLKKLKTKISSFESNVFESNLSAKAAKS